jgi:hypothetical protein
MELVDGESWPRACQRPLPLETTIRYGMQIAEASRPRIEPASCIAI